MWWLLHLGLPLVLLLDQGHEGLGVRREGRQVMQALQRAGRAIDRVRPTNQSPPPAFAHTYVHRQQHGQRAVGAGWRWGVWVEQGCRERHVAAVHQWRQHLQHPTTNRPGP